MISLFKNISSYSKRFFTALPSHQENQGSASPEILQTAISYHQQGKFEEAITLYNEILQNFPDNDTVLHYLGILLSQQGQYDAAIELINRAITVNPTIPEYHSNLGTIHYNHGYYHDAIKAQENALALNPDLTETHYNLGNSLFQLSKFESAKLSYEKAIDLNPEHVSAQYNLGNSLRELGQLEAAVSAFKVSLELAPDFVEAHNNLAYALQEQGKIDKAITCYQQAITIKPDFTDAHSNMLNCLNYLPDIKPEELYEKHLQWAQQHATPLARQIQAHQNNPEPDRRLRIGYVSPDFRRHPIATFIEPVFQAHDQNRFDIFAYYNHRYQDNVTERLQGLINNWRNIARMDNEKVCKLIQEDAIDILVDLSGHTGNNRLLVFASKPAPVQITYLGYPNTTGLSTMDYRLTDDKADPPGQTEHHFSEKLIRLPDSFLCYQPPDESPDVADLPLLSTGHITFGCFNNSTKLNATVIELWSKLFNSLPDARLLLKAPQFKDTACREYILMMFEKQGTAASRIDFAGLTTSFYEHLDTYNRIDIALDCFPYNGTTTTFETLWMGVPVITLTGDSHRDQVGTSIISNIGHSQFIANTHDDFIKIATTLANAPEELSHIRKNLRNDMEHSILTDAKKFTHSLEQIYHDLWVSWCNEKNVKNI